MPKYDIITEEDRKMLKLLYDDFGNPQFARGILKKIEEGFLIIEGDFSEQIIKIDKITKINHIKKEAKK